MEKLYHLLRCKSVSAILHAAAASKKKHYMVRNQQSEKELHESYYGTAALGLAKNGAYKTLDLIMVGHFSLFILQIPDCVSSKQQHARSTVQFMVFH